MTATQPSQRAAGLAAEIERLGPWFHNIHLPDGAQTAPAHPLGDFPTFKWRTIAPHLPAKLNGWTALDIGCNAGFYTIELARRGASVTAIDMDARYLRQARWVAGRFGLAGRIDFVQMQVYDLARLSQSFDLVVFMGVLYHLRYPLLGLEIAARKARKLFLAQTLTLDDAPPVSPPPDLGLNDRQPLRQPGWPKMAFIERRMAGDPTNWWIANAACFEAMMRSVGLRVTARPGEEIYLCQPDPSMRCDEVVDLIECEYRSAVGQSCHGLWP